MRVISRKILRDFCENHADSCDALYDWYRVSSKAEWQNLIDVQQTYPKTEAVGNFTVFNIKGNRYRRIVDLVYDSQRIYIKYVFTHAEYDKDEWKMIRTFDAKSYTDLLVRYQPKPIATEAENDAAIALACELEHSPNRTPEEDIFLELLITLIEKFESENYPIPAGNSASMLKHLMDVRNLDKSDLIPVLGTETKVEEIIGNRREIEIDEARKIADFFQVDISLFLESRSQPI